MTKSARGVRLDCNGNGKIAGKGDRMDNSTGGIGFTGLLAIVFIVLKLCGVITWSWLWVLSPVWITWVVILIIMIVIIWRDRR